MEHLTDAFDRLGVKTCPVCGKTGAKSLCVACRSVSYCGKACQKVAWPTHKRECRRIVRERKKILDGIAAAYAADEARASDECRPNIPPGAECYICGNDKYWKGDLVRGCSCRGPHAGFVHVRCLVANAEVRGEFGDDKAYLLAVRTCTQCRQGFRGAVDVALMRAMWLRCAGRGEMNEMRLLALYNLGAALHDVGRFGEALAVQMELVTLRQRQYGAHGDSQRSLAEEALAVTLRRLGGQENMQLALRYLERIYMWRKERLGPEAEYTLRTASFLAETYNDLGRTAEAERLFRETFEARRRTLGEEHFSTLEACCFLAQQIGSLEMFEKLLPVVSRVMGPENHLSRWTRKRIAGLKSA